MATPIQVRALTPTGDVAYGNGLVSFVSDVDAVAQIIQTRLKFLQGEWWEDRSQGTPLFQSMLGNSGSPKSQQAILALLQQRITGTPYVTGIVSASVTWNAGTRSFGFTTTVSTSFGNVTVTNEPQPATASL